MVRALRKKYITLFFAYTCAGFALFGGNDEELFLRGNTYYAKKDYDNALAAYNTMHKKGRAVFYNMGNCLFNQEKYPEALVYWSRAEVGANLHEYGIIQRNKELALKKLGKQTEQSWWQKIVEVLHSKLPYVSLLFLQLFFLMCWLFLILLIRTKQTRLRKMVQGILCFCTTVFALILGVHYTRYSDNSAIVIKKEAKLFAGPDKSFHVLSSVAYADYAAVKESRQGWHKVKYADMIGWVEADVIQII